MMNEFMEADPLAGKKVLLRPCEMNDVTKIMEQADHYESRVLEGRYMPWSSEQEKDHLKMQSKWASDGKAYVYAIITRDGDALIGSAGLYGIKPRIRSASLGIGILDPSNWDKGYGTDAMKCLLKIGFGVLNLNRIELGVYDYNPRAIHVYSNLGFKHFGKKREAILFEGIYHDEILMDILQEEYFAAINRQGGLPNTIE